MALSVGNYAAFDNCDLRFFDPPCPGDASFYEHLQTFDWYYMSEKPEYEFAARRVDPGSDVLEVGSGKGAFRAFLPESVTYTGLEFNDAAVAQARSLGLRVQRESIQKHAATNSQRYDAVCSFQVLEHVPEAAEFVRGCVEALKPGGKLILAVPAEDSFLAIAPNAFLNMPPHHVSRWSDEALRNLAKRQGLSILDLWHEPIAAFHRSFAANVFAYHWFVSHRLNKQGLIDQGPRIRTLKRLLRLKSVTRLCASSAASRYDHADRGHTVVLVAGAPDTTTQRTDLGPCAWSTSLANVSRSTDPHPSSGRPQ